MKRHLNLATSQLNSTTRQKCNYNGPLPPVYQVNSCEQVKQRIITVRVRKQVVGAIITVTYSESRDVYSQRTTPPLSDLSKGYIYFVLMSNV